MGGAREDVLQKEDTLKVPESKGSRETTVQKGVLFRKNPLQQIRFHESGGKVHFHVDKEKLKCVVPVAIFWAAWAQIKSEDEDYWGYTDGVNNARVTIEARLDIPTEREVVVTVSKASPLGKTAQKIDKFVNG